VVAALGPITNVDCFGNATGVINVTQNGGNGPYSYAWLPNISVTNSASGVPAGTYQVTVTDANGCTSTVSVTVTQPQLLTVAASAVPNAVCAGSSVVLNAVPAGGTSAYNVAWTPGNLIGNSQTITPTASGTDTTFVMDAHGCTAMATVSFTVYPMPTAAFTADILAGCEPICVNFSDNSAISNPGTIVAWNWDFGDGNTSTAQNPNHCYTTSGNYSVMLTVKSSDGCTNTITLPNYITAYANPVAVFSASPQPTTILNAQIYFTDLSINASSWQWNFGDVLNSSSALQNPSFTYFAPTCYPVLLTVTSPNGCTDSTSMPVCIEPDVSIYVPNAFTPNGDGHNETFLPSGTGLDPDKYQLWIFDRWGNLIFTTRDINKGWDGKANGGSNVCEVDTYVWKISAIDNNGNSHALIGSVNLLR
jgi:gliding motility-associated-like protein